MRTSARVMPVAPLAVSAGSDPGRQREQNEDRYHVDAVNGIFLVVDGVGGEAAGEVAAQIAVQTIVNRLARQDGFAEVRVREAITLANQDILRQARERPERAGMSCVLTLAVLEGRQLTIGHVGDSRLYKLSPRGIAKLTHDHSPVGEREDAREISETDAMQHARRNEVYRDVGSEARHPDDPGFIETVFTEVDDDSAILLCSDGLSDMVTSVEIHRIARAHAGDPHRVVEELIAAANDAGGKDNITVVFAEGPAFARNGGSGALVLPPPPAPQVSTTPLAELADPEPAPPSAPGAGIGRRIARSRLTALLLGTVLGLAGAVALLLYGPAALHDYVANPLRDYLPASLRDVTSPRRLVVGSSAAGAYQTIGEALAEARAGDVVSVEPGEYAESLALPADVDLVARVPGKVVLVAPPGGQDWIALSSRAGGGSIRGLRIEGRANAPLLAGIRVLGGDVEIDDVTFEGAMTAAVELAGHGGAATLRSSRFNVVGLPVRIGEGSSPVVRQNVFVAGTNRRTPAVEVAPAATPRLEGNVFVHFPQAIAPAARRDGLLEGNFVIPGVRR